MNLTAAEMFVMSLLALFLPCVAGVPFEPLQQEFINDVMNEKRGSLAEITVFDFAGTYPHSVLEKTELSPLSGVQSMCSEAENI